MRTTLSVLLLISVMGCGSGSPTEENESDDQVNLNNEQTNESGKQTQTSQQKPSESTNKVALPSNFPTDVPVAEEMSCFNVTQVKNNLMVTFHTKMEVKAIVDWYQAKLTENGWEPSGTPLISPTRAILAYQKQDRGCGITVTGFVLDESAQKDESQRGITIQTKAVE